MRLIDADAIDIEHWNYSIVDEGCYEETQAMFDAEPTVEAIPIEWLKENLIGSEFHFGKGVDNTLVGELVWQMIVDGWKEDNGDEWWREEQGDDKG